MARKMTVPRSRKTFLLLPLLPLSTLALNDTPNRRQSASDVETIDPSTMPECAQLSCTPSDDPDLDWYQISNCALVNEQWTKSCFCSQKVPLGCAWACDWDAWMNAEDWYVSEGVCGPDADYLSFDGLPACVKDCLPDAIFNYGCITEGRNCFCSYGELFGCQENCVADSDRHAIQTWLVDQCGITENLAEQGADRGIFWDSLGAIASAIASMSMSATFSELLPLETGQTSQDSKKETLHVSDNGRARLHWYEILAITVLCVSGAAILIIWAMTCIVRHRAEEKPEEEQVENVTLETKK